MEEHRGDEVKKRLLEKLFIVIVVCTLSLVQCSLGAKDTITVTDEAGRTVEVPYPPERIVCLVPSAAEVIYALDESDTIVGIADDCDMPPSLLEKMSVGKSSNRVNVELILDLNPDLVIGKTGGLFPEEIEDQIKMNDVPVLRYRALHISTLLAMIDDLGLILDNEDEAQELNDYIGDYYQTIQDRVGPLSEEEKPKIYFMSMGHVDWTGGSESAGNERIADSGGINLASERPGTLTYVSREWILEENPDIILYSRVSPDDDQVPTDEDYQKTVYNTILSEPGFRDLTAVKDGKLYLFDIGMTSGLTEIVTLLYYAQWFHPQLFEDVDPEEVHQEIFQNYFDLDFEGTWVYQYQP